METMGRKNKRNSGPLLVESGGKLYLFADYSAEDYEATKGYMSSRPIPGKPVSKKDALWLAKALLNHATRR